MPTPTLTQAEMKDAIKAALVELLEERPDLVREVLTDAVEDLALIRAIEEGQRSGTASREEVFAALGVAG